MMATSKREQVLQAARSPVRSNGQLLSHIPIQIVDANDFAKSNFG